MRHLLALVSALVVAGVVAGSAFGGGWASVGFEPLPDDTSAGGTWSPTIFVKQHGVEPLTGLTPVITITEDGSGAYETFVATEMSEAGKYQADVVFPSEGDWRIVIHSGFGESSVSYGPTRIDAGPVGGDSEPVPVVGVAALLAAVAGAAALLFALRRQRKLTPAGG